MNIEEIERELNELKERDDTILFILNALKIDDIISFEGYNKHSDKILKKLSGEKDVFESSKMIMHCFCCGTDITDEKNCFCLKCFNDKIAHDIKKDMVISREDWDYTCGLALLGIDDESESEREELEKLTKIMKEVEKQ